MIQSKLRDHADPATPLAAFTTVGIVTDDQRRSRTTPFGSAQSGLSDPASTVHTEVSARFEVEGVLVSKQSREWSYWTVNKLEILTGYLPAFNKASQGKASERIYIDLMAGQASNIERYTGNEIKGSPRRALESDPGFTKHIFCELPRNAAGLENDLRRRYPDKKFDVIAGDCNETIADILRSLKPISWAPTFVFADQQAAEIHWNTIEQISRFKSSKARTKAEVWMLMSPVMIAKGVRGTNNEQFRDRVNFLYGSEDWLRIQRAKEIRAITPRQYRVEMVNLMRYRLSEDLGYRYTHRIPMRMHNKTEIYDMVFASDHYVGDKIMRSLYGAAAKREPNMRHEAIQLAKQERIDQSGQMSLIEVEAPALEITGADLWRPEAHWQPARNSWW